jgi:hypothetical protein
MASGIALEILVEAVGSEERRTSVKSASESIKASAEKQKAANDKSLEELQKQIDKLAEQKALSPIAKVFKIIGMVLGGIAAVATVALGAVTGNPLLVAAGVIMTALVVDSVLSEVTEGKYSLSALVTHIAKEAGASEEKAKWIALGFTVGLTIVAIGLSFGSALYAQGLDVATKAAAIITKIQLISATVSGANSVASGTLGIIVALNEFDIAETKANRVKIEALLERIKEAIGVEEDFIKFLVENQSAIMSQVAEIVKEAGEAQAQIMSGESPAMA